MSSPVKLVAEALAYRWGELQETPPEFIGDLMVELTTALEAAHRSGEEERAECLDEVLDLLAEGIYKYEHGAGEEVEEERLDRAIAEIRTYYYLKSGILRGKASGAEGTEPKQSKPAEMLSDRDEISIILN